MTDPCGTPDVTGTQSPLPQQQPFENDHQAGIKLAQKFREK